MSPQQLVQLSQAVADNWSTTAMRAIEQINALVVRATERKEIPRRIIPLRAVSLRYKLRRRRLGGVE